MTKEVETLRKDGFTGFVPVAELRGNSSILPDEREYTSSLETKIEHPSSFLLEQAAFSKGKIQMLIWRY